MPNSLGALSQLNSFLVKMLRREVPRQRAKILQEFPSEDVISTMTRPNTAHGPLRAIHLSKEPQLQDPMQQLDLPLNSRDMRGMYIVPDTKRNVAGLADAGWDIDEYNKFLLSIKQPGQFPILRSNLYQELLANNPELRDRVWQKILEHPEAMGVRRDPSSGMWGPSVDFQEYIVGKPGGVELIKE